MKITVTKAEWIADLRANANKQGKTRLRNEDGTFCCVGRLCNLQDPTLWAMVPVDEYSSLWMWKEDNPDAEYVMGHLVLTSLLPDWMTDRQQEMATMANDTFGWTFAQIADWAEAGFSEKEWEKASASYEGEK